MMKMSLAEIANKLSLGSPSKDAVFTGLSKDTRTLKPGNMYIAIRGEKFDGHEFVDDAFKKGASAALVDNAILSDVPQLIVKDTLDVLGKIGTLWRNQFSPIFIGVTGSNGKTTLKNMIASICQAAVGVDAVLATEGNLNNNIGVPLMLSRLTSQHRYAVMEMGMNHFGEIEYLTHMVRPTVAVINNAAESHLEGLKNVAGVAKAKGEIFLGLQKNGTSILNRDDAYFDYWKNLVSKHKVMTFGLENSADVSAIIFENYFQLKSPQGDIDIHLPLLGRHNVMNALAASAVALSLNIDLKHIKKGLETIEPAHGRMEQHVLENGARVIDDTYNANPFSLNAAFKTLATFSGTKIMVLGDMKELGDNTKEMHFNSGKKMREAGIDLLFTLGELSAETTKGFGDNAKHFVDRESLVAAVKPLLKNGVTVLVKGSRSMKMELILSRLIPALENSH
jgi:UDP-N-acetylmuramoyl-tripeptide--D-alanyl-D-alanine ligase